MADRVGLGGIEVVADVGDGNVFNIDVFSPETFIFRVIDDAANVDSPHQTTHLQFHCIVRPKVSILCPDHRNAVKIEVVGRPHDGARHVVVIGKL